MLYFLQLKIGRNEIIEFLYKIEEILGAYEAEVIEDRASQYRQAAVLIPLFRHKGEYKILFTKRTNKVEDHKGQISFPGGAVDEEDDSYEETALREAYEEVGLLKEDVRVLGRTDDSLTLASNYIIHPVVGFVPYPYPFKINSLEVRRLIEVPFNFFVEEYANNKNKVVEHEGGFYEGPAVIYEGDVIWGASARIMENFLDILGEKINLLGR